MGNPFRNNSGEEGEHPPREMLLLCVDGELSPKEAPQLQAHLEACWHCRVRIKKIEEAIADIIEFDEEALKPRLIPPNNWRSFDRQLSQLAAEAGKKSALSRAFSSLGKLFPDLHSAASPKLTLRVAAGLLVTSLVAALVIILSKDPTVSAAELLKKATEAQAAGLRSADQPVVYQKLQVRRLADLAAAREQSVSWEVWNDATHSRFRQSVTDEGGRRYLPAAENSGQPASTVPAVLLELEQVMRANHMNPRQPLSPASYQAWRGSLAEKREEVTRLRPVDGHELFNLRTVPAGAGGVGRIVEASLVVRARDWHPVEQHLKVQSEDGICSYQLTETIYEVISFHRLPAAIFEPPAERPTVASNMSPKLFPPPVASPGPTSYAPPAPGEAELAAAELGARYALHQVNADLGEPIEVVRSDRLVEVRGLAETAQRKQELLLALRNVPHVVANIQTVEEAEGANASHRPRDGRAHPPSEPGTMNDDAPQQRVQTPGLSIKEQLARYYNEHPGVDARSATESVDLKIARLSSEAVAGARSAMAEAWALRRLAERYTPEEMAKLRTADRERLAGMIRARAARIRERVRSLRTMIGPPLAGISRGAARPPVTESPAAVEWSQATRAVFDSAERMNRLTRSLFAGASSEGASAEETVAKLLASFPEVEDRLKYLESATTKF